MINPKELRVGNHLIYGTGNIEDALRVVVETIGKDGINHNTTYRHPDDNNGEDDNSGYTECYEYEALQGIPLTREILKAAGFKSNVLEIKDNFSIVSYNNTCEFQYNDLYYPPSPISSVEYLHQLQNLYFALTGKELQITIPEKVQ